MYVVSTQHTQIFNMVMTSSVFNNLTVITWQILSKEYFNYPQHIIIVR